VPKWFFSRKFHNNHPQILLVVTETNTRKVRKIMLSWKWSPWFCHSLCTCVAGMEISKTIPGWIFVRLVEGICLWTVKNRLYFRWFPKLSFQLLLSFAAVCIVKTCWIYWTKTAECCCHVKRSSCYVGTDEILVIEKQPAVFRLFFHSVNTTVTTRAVL